MKIRFSISDLIQQILGGYLIAGPFIIEDGFWLLAENMTTFHSLIAILMVIIIGFGASTQDDKEQDSEEEEIDVDNPLRLVSLISVAYLSVGSLIFVFNAIETFNLTLFTAFKGMSLGAIFSLVGAAAMDSIL